MSNCNNRRYQTLPNLRALRKKSKGKKSAGGLLVSNVFEGIFSSLGKGVTPARALIQGNTHAADSAEDLSRTLQRYFSADKDLGDIFERVNRGQGELLNFSLPEGDSGSCELGPSASFKRFQDSETSVKERKRVDGRRETRGRIRNEEEYFTPDGRVEGRGAPRFWRSNQRKSSAENRSLQKDLDLLDRRAIPNSSSHLSKAERLSEYEQYFASLLVETHPDHPGYDELCKSNERLGQLLSRRDEDVGELERIQELFPNDNLRLYEKDPVSQKMKGLIRKRSTTAARLHRAFSAKGLRATDGQPHFSANNNNNNNHYNKDAYHSDPNEIGGGGSGEGLSCSEGFKEAKTTRSFVMETPVHLTTGVQSQERHLFLFTDLLLVAKARSGGNFKLKEKVRVSEMWMANCLDDVAEVHKSSDTSFVVGWPTTNVVASFSCVATKDLWYNKLSQLICEEREKEPDSTTIQITYYDPLTGTDICKTLNIGSTTTARECVSLILSHLEVNVRDEDKFQLWVKNQGDEAPYPLIGHEFPFAIKMNCYRELVQDCEGEHCNSLYNTDVLGRCQFILRQERKPQSSFGPLPEAGKKLSKKAKKSPIKIHKVFKRSNSKGDVTDGISASMPSGVLFGHHLANVCEADGSLPRIVMDMLNQLFLKGPFTLGIFRKSANARLVRELKEKIDAGEHSAELEGYHITAIAALFKDFLRSLPDSLLCSDLYEDWLSIPHLHTSREKISHILLLCSRLPRSNLSLLQHFLCVLHHIARRASVNMMSSSNLAICVGPSLLWPSTPNLALSPEASKQGPGTLEFLIERCCDIFGKDILHLLGDPPEQDPLRQDSGAEESDSLHSGHSIHSSGGLRRDDSSIDSLEREFLVEGELSPLPRKDKMSLTNLSRDSGLTMSDSQLYTPDEEESESTSSGHSGENKNFVPSCNDQLNERFQHYTAPNNPNAIYTAVHRRQERMQNAYDESENYYAAPNREHSRVHITYSSPNYNYGQVTLNKDYTLYQDQSDPYLSNYGREDEPIYSVPSGLSPQDVMPFTANSNFKRHDWMRRRSNLRKVSKTNSIDGGLLRSSSEESLLNKYEAEYGVSLGPAGNCAPAAEPFMKGRALPPPPLDYCETLDPSGRESPLRRSKSAHQIIETGEELAILSVEQSSVGRRPPLREHNKWHRSRSTPQIHDEGDRSYDSSTLSDDDSTPHVSRSNSRGKECGHGNLHAWEAVDSQEDSRNSSFKSERTSSVCTVVSAGSTSTLSSNPPSYEETLSRRSLMQNSPQQSNSNNDHSIREEKIKSARAKQLYEESLRIYQEENTYPCDLVRASPAHAHDSDDPERPPPLPPKSDPPPLPPKQRASKRLSEGASKLKHLPPVHVETASRKVRAINQLSFEPQTAPLHKTIIYTNDNPPCLPPKERTIIEVEASYFPDKRSQSSGATRSLSPPQVEKKSIETQTDECDLLDDDFKDEGIQTSGNWLSEQHHITSVPVSDHRDARRRGRSRRKDSPTSYRSRSMPGRNAAYASEEEFEEEEGENEWEEIKDFHSSNYGIKDLKQLDPDLQQEISWSVSQLRAIFGDTLNGAKVHPPPYRPPPTSHGTRITSYHLGAGEAFTCRKPRQTTSGYEEESYV